MYLHHLSLLASPHLYVLSDAQLLQLGTDPPTPAGLPKERTPLGPEHYLLLSTCSRPITHDYHISLAIWQTRTTVGPSMEQATGPSRRTDPDPDPDPNSCFGLLPPFGANRCRSEHFRRVQEMDAFCLVALQHLTEAMSSECRSPPAS
ncbi:hypothetical protein LZ31DRAFT_140395 [Colletotrichum somersetense]|nr:hypothetical protein LZ31DRAFT_140395 [Colletotrichum somersetense]